MGPVINNMGLPYDKVLPLTFLIVYIFETTHCIPYTF